MTTLGRMRVWARRGAADAGRRCRAGWYRFRADRRGATAVQALVFLPVILFTLTLLMVLWQTLTIRRSLHHGVYQATRYLSLYPPDSVNPTPWEEVARQFVYGELANNPFVDTNRLSPPLSEVSVDLVDGGYACKQKFRIRAKYGIARAIPSLQGTNFVLPHLTWAYLQEDRLGEVLCE